MLTLRKISVLIFCFLLTGCGFHLRGHMPLPPQLRVLYLQPNSPFSAFTKQLRSTLMASGVQLVCAPTMAPVTLQILSDHYGQSVATVGSSGQVTTYILSYNITYQLKDSTGKPIQCLQSIGTTRTYSITSNQMLSDTSAMNSLKEDMQRDVIYQMFNHLHSPCTLHAVGQLAY